MNEIPITKDETKIANEESYYLFGYLRKKYCNENCTDFDIILNSLSFALLRMIHLTVRPEDKEAMVGIINQILMKGIQSKETS